MSWVLLSVLQRLADPRHGRLPLLELELELSYPQVRCPSLLQLVVLQADCRILVCLAARPSKRRDTRAIRGMDKELYHVDAVMLIEWYPFAIGLLDLTAAVPEFHR